MEDAADKVAQTIGPACCGWCRISDFTRHPGLLTSICLWSDTKKGMARRYGLDASATAASGLPAASRNFT